jgi:hypothetical protein
MEVMSTHTGIVSANIVTYDTALKFYGYVCKYARMFEELYVNLEKNLLVQMKYE